MVLLKTQKIQRAEIVNDINEIITTVYRQFYNTVYRHCLEKLFYHQQNAENITQTVFMIYVKKYYKVQPDKVKAWLISVADREIKSFKRKVAKTESVNLDDYCDIVSDESLDVLEEIINQELLKQENEIEEQIVSSLKPNQRKLLQYIKSGLSTPEIAKEMGIDRRRVTVRTYHLKKKVRELIRQQKEKII